LVIFDINNSTLSFLDKNKNKQVSIKISPNSYKFQTIDRYAEKFQWQSPYCYAANNPIKFIDIMGDSATLQGNGAQNALNFLNAQFSGYYTFSMNANGLVAMTAVPQQNNQQNTNGQQNATQQTPMTTEQQQFANQLNTIFNGNGMTNINVVNNDNNVLVGDINTHTMDIGDIQQFGTGQWVDQTGAFIHEANEQYNLQVNHTSQQTAHIRATVTESRTTGNVYDPIRPSSAPASGTGTVTVPVRDPATGQWHNVMVNYVNGNVISITR
jgi:hypothetical protein